MTKKLKSLKELRKLAWKTFSIYVRQRDMGICFTCGKRDNWKSMQAGHLFHRDCLDYDEKNINCQCVRCNHYLSGNLQEYTYRFIKKYGEKEYLRLKRESHQVRRFKRQELLDIITKYEM